MPVLRTRKSRRLRNISEELLLDSFQDEIQANIVKF